MDLARRIYTRETKIAAMRAIESGRTMVPVARQLEVSPNLLQRWRSERRVRGEFAAPGMRRRTEVPALSEQQRIAELERKIGQLTMENDVLKKALQHFREQHPPAVVSGAVVCLRKSVKRQQKAKP